MNALRIQKYFLRYSQWQAALALAGHEVSWWKMIRALFSGRVDARTYARRLRACRACIIYDRETRTCRAPNPFKPEQPLGCGCYVPYKAKARAPYSIARANTIQPGAVVRGCWGRVHVGHGFGWGEPDTPPPARREESSGPFFVQIHLP